MSEKKLQADCFQWADATFPETRKLLFHVGNERNTGIPYWIKNILKQKYPYVLALLEKYNKPKIQGAQLTAIGVVSGVPDLILLWKGKTYGFELKVEGRKQSPKQKLWEITATPHIEKYYLITNFEDFKFHFTQIVHGNTSTQ